MKLNLKVLALLLAALVAFEVYFTLRDRAHTTTLLAQIADAHATSLQLEQEIGYGGLIHNFKNYILRPGEPAYLERAAANATRARELAENLETTARSLGVEVSLSATRRMIDAYDGRLDVIADMVADGATPAEIDIRVRYDDRLALEEIALAADNIVSTINTHLAQVQRAHEFRLILVFALIAAGIAYLFATLRDAQRREHEIQKANTALQASNLELERKNTALRQFAGIAAHDLRSPARQITLMVDMMSRVGADPAKVADLASEIRAAALRLDGLVASLFDYAKTGFANPRKSDVDPNQLATDVIRDLASEIDARAAKITVADLPPIHADPDLIKRVFQNLIENSLYYAREDTAPEIAITSTSNADETAFSFTDNGIGIDAVHADKIFEPMQRLHDRRSARGGAGIGLSLVKSIVESHGGRAWLDVNYGQGARICFTISAKRNGERGDVNV